MDLRGFFTPQLLGKPGQMNASVCGRSGKGSQSCSPALAHRVQGGGTNLISTTWRESSHCPVAAPSSEAWLLWCLLQAQHLCISGSCNLLPCSVYCLAFINPYLHTNRVLSLANSFSLPLGKKGNLDPSRKFLWAASSCTKRRCLALVGEKKA